MGDVQMWPVDPLSQERQQMRISKQKTGGGGGVNDERQDGIGFIHVGSLEE